MKRQVFSAFVAVGIIAGSCRADEPAKPQVATNGTPKIQFDKTVYDFGTTSSVTKLDGVIVVSNVGTAPLEKLQAERHCGCTTTGFKVDKLAPGEKTELPFSVVVNPLTPGPLDKKITIHSSDPKQPNVDLALKANIVILYEATPAIINIGDLHVGSSTNFSVPIRRTDGKPLGVTAVEGASTQVHGKLVAKEGVADAATIYVQVTAANTAGPFGDSVRVFGANPELPLLTIPVNGRLVNDVVLSQSLLMWNVGDPGNWPGTLGGMATTRRIIVTSFRPDQSLEVSDLTCSVPELKVQFHTITDGKQYELIAVLEKLPKESTAGTIKFATNLKSQPTVEVKISISIGKPS